MIKDALNDAEARMKSALASLEEDLAGIRTGRAQPALVEKVMVDYYGTATPLKQLATIAAPEMMTLTIRPFDPGAINAIEKAIRTSDLNLTPDSDGKMIRITLPPLNQQRRNELIKLVSKRLEEAKIAVRNVRRDTMDDLKEMEKEKIVTEDDHKRGREELQKLTDKMTEQIDQIGSRKEQEIREL